MKKLLQLRTPRNPGGLACLLLLLAGLLAPAWTGAQTVTVRENGKTVRELLSVIEARAGVYFFYSDADVDLDRTASIDADGQPLASVLDNLFRNSTTTYTISGNQVYLKRAETVPERQEEPVRLRINGTVRDTEGEVLVGATVIVDGTSTGVLTGLDGGFTLEVPAGARLRISYVGYQTQYVDVSAARTRYDVELKGELEVETVVVVAYGTQRKETVTGSISTITDRELKKSSSVNMSNALSGRIPGLMNVQSSGQPGADNGRIYLRGMATLNGTSPIILIDGVPRDNMDMLDPNEVESISVLKDASATAVFGVRGANGAIIITTKRGQVGRMQMSVNFESSLQSFTRTPERLESWDWMALRNQVAVNESQPVPYTDEYIARYKNKNKTPLEEYMYPSHYWYGEMMRKFAPQMRLNINMNGGTDRMQYFINTGYIHQGGQFKIEDGLDYNPQVRLNRYTFRGNVDYKISNRLKAYLNLASYLEKVGGPSSVAYGESSRTLMSEIFRSLMYSRPYEMGPLTIEYEGSTDPAGEVVKFDNLDRTAYELVNRSGYQMDTRMSFNGSYGMEFDMGFITRGLSLKGVASLDAYSNTMQFAHSSVQQYQATIINDKPIFSTNMGKGGMSTRKGTSHYYQVNLQASLNYDNVFGDHRVGGLLLAQRDYWETSGGEIPYNVLGFCARLTYSYADRYLAEFNMGYNGSEQFSPERRFGFFPAYSLGWVASNEQFFRPLLPVVNNLKFRASYGKVGNDQQGASRFLYLDQTYYRHNSSNGAYGEFFLGSLSNGYYISEGLMGNQRVTWETASKYNYGVDLQLLRSIGISFDYFTEKRNDILIQREMVPELQGVPISNIPRVNMGEMKNYGYEVELNYTKRVNDDLTLTARGNFSFTRNKVLFADEPLLGEDYAYRYRKTGLPLGTFFGYQIDYSNGNGYFNTQADIDNYKTADGRQITYDFGQYQLGDFIYVDQNGDGVIDVRDQVPLGNTMMPEISYGISLGAEYKWFDFSVFFQGLANTSNFYLNEGVYEFIYGGMYFDYHKTAWTPERYAVGQKITYPKLRSTSSVSHTVNSFFVMDRSFVRLKHIELGFTLPEKWVRKAAISNMRIYVSGQNLFTWDRLPMKTLDPEQYADSNNLFGTVYPIPKLYSFGLNITF